MLCVWEHWFGEDSGTDLGAIWFFLFRLASTKMAAATQPKDVVKKPKDLKSFSM